YFMGNLFQHPTRKVGDLLGMWLSGWDVETSNQDDGNF
ncbi:MAG: hypothetical protein JWQ57_1416, partial [Mucilaginibacter sp.]|nr:hypothetical protein [Mucilaginibacter sp.]